MTKNATIVSCLLTATLAAQESPELQQTLREWCAIRAADAVVVARVVKVHESPGVWCGHAVSRQVVTYRVERLVDGKPREDRTVDVAHLLVAGSPLVAPHAPFLRPELFYEGAQAVLCVSADDRGQLVVRDETYGARLVTKPRAPDAAQRALVAAVLALPGLRPYWHLEQPDERPRCALNAAVPLPIDVAVEGRRVEFLPPELLRDQRHLEITRLERDDDEAHVTFRIAAEGVVGTARLVRDKEAWRVVDSDVAER